MSRKDHTDRRPEYRQVFVGSDHAGFGVLKKLTLFLRELGYDVVDCVDANKENDDDYPDVAFRLHRIMKADGKVRGEGILLCGSGEGMCIAANKFPDIRAVEIQNEEEAKLSRVHNGSNVLCLGTRELTVEEMKPIISSWLTTPFSEEDRHMRRRKKLDHLGRAGAVYNLKSGKIEERIMPAILTEDVRQAHNQMLQVYGHVRWVQIDIADETFTTSKTFAPDSLELDQWPFFFDAHLMVDNPAKYIDPCARSGYARVTFHRETVEGPQELIDMIHSYDMEAGVALNPKTPLTFLDDIVRDVDAILLLGVTPGLSGQEMTSGTMARVETLRKKIPRSLPIWVDGGVSQENFVALLEAGARGVCANSMLFDSNNIEKVLKNMSEWAQKVRT